MTAPIGSSPSPFLNIVSQQFTSALKNAAAGKPVDLAAAQKAFQSVASSFDSLPKAATVGLAPAALGFSNPVTYFAKALTGNSGGAVGSPATTFLKDNVPFLGNKLEALTSPITNLQNRANDGLQEVMGNSVARRADNQMIQDLNQVFSGAESFDAIRTRLEGPPTNFDPQKAAESAYTEKLQKDQEAFMAYSNAFMMRHETMKSGIQNIR